MTESRQTIIAKCKNPDGTSYVDKIWPDKFNPKIHKKLFWRNLCEKLKTVRLKINWNNPWAVTIIGGLIVTILGSVFFLNDSKSVQTNLANIEGDNNVQILGNNNVVMSSEYLDEQEKIWNESYKPIQDFVNKLNNKDFDGARFYLDKQLVKDPLFSVDELKNFVANVDGQITIRNVKRDDSIKKDDEYVSNRGFYLYLRYLKNDKQVSEGWRMTVIKYNKEDNVWKIGLMRCEDKRCESESLLAEKNI